MHLLKKLQPPPKLLPAESSVLSQERSNPRYPSLKTSALMRSEEVCCCFKALRSNVEMPFYWEQLYKPGCLLQHGSDNAHAGKALSCIHRFR